MVLEFSSALYLASSSAWVSMESDWIVKPHEKGFPKVKKSSSYLMWIFLISNFTPLNSLVNSPMIGGTENSPCFASFFLFYSAAYAAGFRYLFASSAILFLCNSYLCFARFSFRFFLSSFLSSFSFYRSGFLISSTSSCIMTIFVT